MICDEIFKEEFEESFSNLLSLSTIDESRLRIIEALVKRDFTFADDDDFSTAQIKDLIRLMSYFAGEGFTDETHKDKPWFAMCQDTCVSHRVYYCIWSRICYRLIRIVGYCKSRKGYFACQRVLYKVIKGYEHEDARLWESPFDREMFYAIEYDIGLILNNIRHLHNISARPKEYEQEVLCRLASKWEKGEEI